jgi:hypothetical protein
VITACASNASSSTACQQDVAVGIGLRHRVCARAGNDECLNTTLLLSMHGVGIAARSAENQVRSTVRRPGMHMEICRLVAWVESHVHGGPGDDRRHHRQSRRAVIASLIPRAARPASCEESQTGGAWALRECTCPAYKLHRACGCIPRGGCEESRTDRSGIRAGLG